MRSDIAWRYVFVLGFVAIAAAETFLPRQSLPTSTPRRWTSNFLLLAVSSFVVAIAYQFSLVALAFTVRDASQGVLNRAPVPDAVQFALGFGALDFTGYLSHRLFHAIALMWRVHQVHHSETDLDLSTAFRFHPLEALITQGLLLSAIVLLGPPPAAVALIGLVVVVQNYLQHANLRFPETADRVLRWLFITPDMHRLHHSQQMKEQNKNFGTVFSLWDRLFGTYAAGTFAPASESRCGLLELADGSTLNAGALLLLPFRRSRPAAAEEANETKEPASKMWKSAGIE